MALRMAKATGNFNTAGTWGLIDTTSLNNTETTTTALTTTYALSSAFTPGAIVVEGIGVKLSVRTGATGTISVSLAQGGVTVVGTEVTINVADLPVSATADLNGGWIFFKFAVPITLLVATAYTVQAKTSNASQVSLFSTATTNWARYLRTATTGAPGAGDDLIIGREYTGAGTGNDITVTMDNTATTDFGVAPTTAISLVQPGIAIGKGGALTWGVGASTAYFMRMSNSIIIYSGGTMNMGTVATPCPRGSSNELYFDCGANVDYGLVVRNLGTLVTQGLSRTSGKLIDRCLLNTDEAVNSTSLGVDTDTGWLDNDVIAVATTTQTIAQSEKGALNGNAGASSLTVDGFAGVSGGLAFAHLGTSPIRAEVILLTRNVIIRGASATLQGYIDIKATAQVDCDWTEFYWLGSATANKRGIDIATTTGSCSFNRCSAHDMMVTNSRNFNSSSASGNNISITDCVTFDINTFHVGSSASSGIMTITGNIFMKNVSSFLASLGDVGGVFSNNVCIGGAGYGVVLNEANAQLGTFSGNTIHSCVGGLSIPAVLYDGTIQNTILYRNSSFGLNIQALVEDVVFDTMTFFGNTTASISFSTTGMGMVGCKFLNITSNGDTGFATTAGILISNAMRNFIADCEFINCDFSTVAGIKTAHTNDISVASSSFLTMYFNNTKFGGATEVLTPTNMLDGSYIASDMHDQTEGLFKTWLRRGIIQREVTTVHTGSQSMKLTPNNASNKMQTIGPLGGFKVPITDGATVDISAYVYEDASYNGNRARLVVKRNDGLGISADTVLDTATSASDLAWELLTGTTPAVTADGVLEFFIDCDGTAGNLFVDSLSVA